MGTVVRPGVGARRLAWGLAALVVALQIGRFAFAAMSDAVRPGGPSDIFITAIALAFAVLGVLIAAREPRNPIGWLSLGVAMSTGVASIAHVLVQDRLAGGGAQHGLVGAAAAYSDASWVPFILIPATLLVLLFPDGRLPSPRWRWVLRCSIVGIVGVFLTSMAVEELADFPTVDNPLALDTTLLEPLTGLSFLSLGVGMIGSVASIVWRYRRAGHRQRQQIKWLATAGAIILVTIPTMVVLYDVVGESAADGTMMASVLGLPAAMGVAILRHDLYDIDVVINRTLVYGALTGLLAAAYFGTVVLLQFVLSPSSDLAIAGSTLAVAALVRPGRARIQELVDRRFYRSHYDARLTLEAFSGRLRDEVSLDALSHELRGVVTDTMQPAHVSLWLRGMS